MTSREAQTSKDRTLALQAQDDPEVESEAERALNARKIWGQKAMPHHHKHRSSLSLKALFVSGKPKQDTESEDVEEDELSPVSSIVSKKSQPPAAERERRRWRRRKGMVVQPPIQLLVKKNANASEPKLTDQETDAGPSSHHHLHLPPILHRHASTSKLPTGQGSRPLKPKARPRRAKTAPVVLTGDLGLDVDDPDVPAKDEVVDLLAPSYEERRAAVERMNKLARGDRRQYVWDGKSVLSC